MPVYAHIKPLVHCTAYRYTTIIHTHHYSARKLIPSHFCIIRGLTRHYNATAARLWVVMPKVGLLTGPKNKGSIFAPETGNNNSRNESRNSGQATGLWTMLAG